MYIDVYIYVYMYEVKYTLFPANEDSRGERKYHVPNST